VRDLVEVVVAELGGHEQEAGLEHAHRRGDWHGVEVLDFDFGDEVVLGLERDFEDVALLGLGEEEEHRFGLVGCAADE